MCAGACFKNNDPKSCGSCDRDCTGLPNVKPGSATCQASKCAVPADGCVAGHAHCSANPDDICETDLSNAENCGMCGKKCTVPTPFCTNVAGVGTCVLSCAGATPNECGATCVDLKTDVANCGTCGHACSLPNADAACVNSACVMVKCKDGFGDCSAEPGCETSLTTAGNCGMCGKSCAVTNGGAACSSGTCGAITCNPGWGNCDGNPDCETSLTTSSNCGKCGTMCDVAKPLCSTVGGVQTCVSDCMAAAPTKCGAKCVDTKTDVANCGSCGMVCSFPNADATCVNSQCTQSTCKTGFGDCNAQPGCETALNSIANCGSCGSACTYPNATGACTNSQCAITTCSTGFGNCNAQPGCETSLDGDANCGTCGHACGANLKCDGASRTCVDICTLGGAGTPSHCCNSTACANGFACVTGVCKTTCANNTDCVPGNFCSAGSCMTLKATGGSCGGNDQCTSGLCRDAVCCPASCILTCQACAMAATGSPNGTCATRTTPAGTQVCGGQCVNVKGTDANNCGSCGHSCQGGTCENGTCQPFVLGTVATGIGGLVVNSTRVFTFDAAQGATNVNVYAVPKSGGTLSTITTVPGNSASTVRTFPSYSGGNDSLLIFQITSGGFGGTFSALYSCNPGNCTASRQTWFTGFSGQATACDLSGPKCFSQNAGSNSVLLSTPTTMPQAFNPDLKIAAGHLTVAGGFLYAAGPSDPVLLFQVLERVIEAGTSAKVRLANRGFDSGDAQKLLFGPIRVTTAAAFALGNMTDPSAGTVARLFSVPLPLGVGDSAPSLFTGGTAVVGAYWADDAAVAWFNSNQQLVTCPTSGCSGAPTILANGNSADLTADSQAFYWIAINSTDPNTGSVTSASVVKLAR